MGVEALVGGLFGLASAGIQAATANHVQSANAAAQASINEKTMKFNRKEAAKARKFTADQAVLDRNFNASEAQLARDFNAAQTSAAMNFTSDQSAITRQFNAAEAAKSRAFNANESSLARSFNAQESLLARQFEERMANSAHQREVSDLRAAGLNPILSATGGNGAAVPVAPVLSSPMASSSPASVNSASGVASSSPAAAHNTAGAAAAMVSGLSAYQRKNIIGEFVNSARDAVRLSLDYERAKIADKEADAKAKDAETNRLRQVADAKHIDQQIKTLRADENWKNWSAKTEEEKVKLVAEQIISEKKRQTNEAKLTDARVSEAYAIAGAAVKNAEINARRQEVDAELGRAASGRDRERLENEKQKLDYQYNTGSAKVERDWVRDHPYWSHTLKTVDKVMEAVSPIKLRFLKD